MRNHDYGKSRFLRGARIDEARIADAEAAQAHTEALPVRYLHEERPTVHFLDKPLSFDDEQDAIYRICILLVAPNGGRYRRFNYPNPYRVGRSGVFVLRAPSSLRARAARSLRGPAAFLRNVGNIADRTKLAPTRVAKVHLD